MRISKIPMYGLSKIATDNLAFLVGKEICQVAIGSFDVQFNWGNGGISVESRFTYAPNGMTPIVWNGEAPEAATKIVRLLNVTITGIESGESLKLTFSNGDQLEIFEDERYESFSIRDGKNPLIVV
jgi:hypothetical protein